jgi:hypothetical protein
MIENNGVIFRFLASALFSRAQLTFWHPQQKAGLTARVERSLTGWKPVKRVRLHEQFYASDAQRSPPNDPLLY